MVLTQKEFVQMVRDFKIIWLPITFILLGVTQPVVTYFLPSILESLGGGQGIMIDPNMSPQKGGEILAGTIGSQFDQLGLMIIVISMMGIVQADKANGMLSFILTRPVSIISYVSGKIVSNYLMIAFSVALGYFASYLYVNYLFTSVPFSHMMIGLLFYLIWVLFIASFTTMISTIFHSQGIIALISIVFLLVSRMIVGLNPILDPINPASMSHYAMEVLITGSVYTNMLSNLLFTMIWIVLTIIITNHWIAKKKFACAS